MAVDMFLDIQGVKGESKDKNHPQQIDVLAWSWGMSNSGSAHVGGGAGSGKVSVHDVRKREPELREGRTGLHAAEQQGRQGHRDPLRLGHRRQRQPGLSG